MKMSSDPKGLNFWLKMGWCIDIQSYVSLGLVEDIMKTSQIWRIGNILRTRDDYKTYTFHLRDDVLWHEPAVDNASGQYDWLLNGKSCRDGHFISGDAVWLHTTWSSDRMMMNNQVAGAALILFKDLDNYSAPDDFTW